MSHGINKVILIGNLGADPEVRVTPSGDAVAALRLATSESWKDKQTGELVERTEWHRVILWRRLAEIAQQYLHKGSRVYIEGKLQTRKWQAQDGSDRYTTEIQGNEMQMLDGRPTDSAPREERSSTAETRSPTVRPKDQDQAISQAPSDFDDDIPF